MKENEPDARSGGDGIEQRRGLFAASNRFAKMGARGEMSPLLYH